MLVNFATVFLIVKAPTIYNASTTKHNRKPMATIHEMNEGQENEDSNNKQTEESKTEVEDTTKVEQ